MPDIRALRVTDRVISKCKKPPPGVYVRGSTNSFVNARPQIRMFDKPKPGPGPLLSGSNKSFINSKPAGRVKDKVFCGKNISGSNNTFIY